MKFLNRSRRGLSLVEVIVSTVIMTVIIGAACTALYAGSASFHEGAAEAANHGDAYLLESYLLNYLPTAKTVDISTAGPVASANSISIYFDSATASDANDVAVYKDGRRVMTVVGIESIALSSQITGSHKKLVYTITAAKNAKTYTVTGAIVLNNIGGTSAQADFGSGVTLSSTDTSANYLNYTYVQ